MPKHWAAFISGKSEASIVLYITFFIQNDLPEVLKKFEHYFTGFAVHHHSSMRDVSMLEIRDNVVFL